MATTGARMAYRAKIKAKTAATATSAWQLEGRGSMARQRR